MSQALTLTAEHAIAAEDRYRHKYLIAIAVTLAAVLELIDTSIVNVAIPGIVKLLSPNGSGPWSAAGIS